MEDIMPVKELKELLTNKILNVTFTKVNGDTRTMHCTLMESVLPKATKEDPLTQKKVRAINEEVQVVWDIQSNGFRSFRYSNVTKVEIETTNND